MKFAHKAKTLSKKVRQRRARRRTEPSTQEYLRSDIEKLVASRGTLHRVFRKSGRAVAAHSLGLIVPVVDLWREDQVEMWPSIDEGQNRPARVRTLLRRYAAMMHFGDVAAGLLLGNWQGVEADYDLERVENFYYVPISFWNRERFRRDATFGVDDDPGQYLQEIEDESMGLCRTLARDPLPFYQSALVADALFIRETLARGDVAAIVKSAPARDLPDSFREWYQQRAEDLELQYSMTER